MGDYPAAALPANPNRSGTPAPLCAFAAGTEPYMRVAKHGETIMRLIPITCLTLAAVAAPSLAQAPRLDPKTAIYEMRIYYPAPGKSAALNARFRGHTTKLFAKHGMKNVAYWNEQPTAEQPDGRLVYVMAYPSRAARDASWKAFVSDPEWLAVQSASEANGKIVAKVESIFMTMADYSPLKTLPR
jgi:hypothetical protein